MQPNAYTESNLRSFLILAGLVAVSQLAGVTGSLVTDPSFYGELARPSWAPPPWLFAPVWVTPRMNVLIRYVYARSCARCHATGESEATANVAGEHQRVE